MKKSIRENQNAKLHKVTPEIAKMFESDIPRRRNIDRNWLLHVGPSLINNAPR